MGCDGGTIPRRDELVKTKKKPEQVDKDAEISARWKHCSISQEELVLPIMACELGRLYNKDSVITLILEKGQNSSENAEHIRGLKDVIELKLTEIPSYDRQGPDKGDRYVDRQASQYICPVVGLEMNGKHRFCFLRICGCVMSERALKEVKSETCHKCGRLYTDDEIVLLNGSENEIEDLRDQMNERRARAKLDKKAKKNGDLKTKASDLNGEDCGAGTSKKMKLDGEKTPAVATGSKLKLSADLPSTSAIVGASTSNGKQRPIDKTKATYSINKDPRASEAFKSMFTSHDTFKNQPKAHWVTHNPLFY